MPQSHTTDPRHHEEEVIENQLLGVSDSIHFCLHSDVRVLCFAIRHFLVLPFTILKIAIGEAPITQLRTCVINIVTFKGGHLIW